MHGLNSNHDDVTIDEFYLRIDSRVDYDPPIKNTVKIPLFFIKSVEYQWTYQPAGGYDKETRNDQLIINIRDDLRVPIVSDRCRDIRDEIITALNNWERS